MNCTEVQQRLVEHLLDETQPQVNREIEEHLESGCTDCMQHFREVQQSTDAFFASVPSDTID